MHGLPRLSGSLPVGRTAGSRLLNDDKFSPKTAMTDKPGTAIYEALKSQVATLEHQLAELTASLPAHSLSPSMLAKLEDLEAALEKAQRDLTRLSDRLFLPPAE